MSPACIPGTILLQLLRLNNDNNESAGDFKCNADERLTVQPEQPLQAGDPTLVGTTPMEEKKMVQDDCKLLDDGGEIPKSQGRGTTFTYQGSGDF